MKLTTKRKEQISSVLIICLGNILNAFSARVFLLPADLVAGGTTGIGLILQRITGIPLSSLVLAFNIIMLVLAYIFLGKKIYIICNFKLFYVSDRTGILQSDPWRLYSDRQSDPMHTLCWHWNRNLPWNDHPYRCFYRWRRRSATDFK